MKKFMVILMLVAMASFVFVGCIPTAPVVEEEEEEEEVVVAPVSDAPVIIDIQSSTGTSIVTVGSASTQYMSIAEVGTSILVVGTGVSESLIQILLDGVVIPGAVGETATNGLWSVAVAKTSLGDDGVKVFTAKQSEISLEQSEASNAATATLDTVRPSATTLAASAASTAATTLTSAVTAGTALVNSFVTAGASGTIAAGTWTVRTVAASGTALNIEVSDGTTPVLYTVITQALFSGVIPGVRFDFLTAGLNSVGSITTLTIVRTTTIADRVKVGFNEDITNASAIALANYTFTTGGVANVPTAVIYSAEYMYFSPMVTAALVQNASLGCSVLGVEDLAGNIQTTASALTCTVGVAHATSLAP